MQTSILINPVAATRRSVPETFRKHVWPYRSQSCFSSTPCSITFGPMSPDIGFEKTGGWQKAIGTGSLLGSMLPFGKRLGPHRCESCFGKALCPTSSVPVSFGFGFGRGGWVSGWHRLAGGAVPGHCRLGGGQSRPSARLRGLAG